MKGPISPLEMSVKGISRNSAPKIIKIESQSVNSVLLDSDPNDYHERQVFNYLLKYIHNLIWLFLFLFGLLFYH